VENRAGKTVVLVIDEAQNLSPLVLEQIRLISNLATESDKLIQIVLAGQPELLVMLAKPELRQLAQRITVRYHLLPMDFEDSTAYIRHRIQVAGGGGWINFTARALKKIYRFAQGSPRLLNIACDRTLLTAYTENKGDITGDIAATAIHELTEGRKAPVVNLKLALAVIIAALVLALVVFGALQLHEINQETANNAAALSIPAGLFT
jgi:general secretion pathway protein A